jgi:hypothetical protein
MAWAVVPEFGSLNALSYEQSIYILPTAYILQHTTTKTTDPSWYGTRRRIPNLQISEVSPNLWDSNLEMYCIGREVIWYMQATNPHIPSPPLKEGPHVYPQVRHPPPQVADRALAKP